ncbi:hypothetical protein McaMca56_001788 [Microsporum canis]
MLDASEAGQGYNFFIVNDGIDKYSSMLRSSVPMHRRRFSLETGSVNARSNNAVSSPAPERRRDYSTYAANKEEEDDASTTHVQAEAKAGVDEDDGLAGLTRSMSALRFVPHSVTVRMQSRKDGR